MDFDLSSICSMLGDRIEEYKSTTKKRKIESGSESSRTKYARLSSHSKTDRKITNYGTQTSTPIETPKSKIKFHAPGNFSTIKLSSHDNLRYQIHTQTVKPKKISFEDSEDHRDGGNSPLSFPSVTKLPRREYLKRRPKIGKVLTFDDEDDEENVLESSALKGSIENDVFTSTETPESRTIQESHQITSSITKLSINKKESYTREDITEQKTLFDVGGEDTIATVKSTNNLKNKHTYVETPKSNKNLPSLTEVTGLTAPKMSPLNKTKSLRKESMNPRRLRFMAEEEETDCAEHIMSNISEELSRRLTDPSLVLNVNIFVYANK